ncbi:MAG TPA: hypothetical protein PLU64_17045, partial [Saprospiraceae bacterium]|nr:hypothetical protein [Saprospiraceae bacterium]
IQYSYENPEKEEGAGETLKLLALQSDQLLRSNRSQLAPYLEWVSQKNLGAGAAEQIKELQDRAGF